jgi:type I restriction enzyme, S subunit
MKRYESYKDSGVEWIGEIPSGWKQIRLKNIGYLYGGLTGKKGDDFKQENNPNNKPFIPFTNISDNFKISPTKMGQVVINEDDEQNRVEKDDLFFLMSSEDQDGIGQSSVLVDDIGEVYLNTFCRGFRVQNHQYYPVFLNYLLHGHSYREILRVEGRGFTRINLRSHGINDFKIFTPPLPEQHQIVEFLDRKTNQIDTLIEKKQRKIDLLKEYRISLINHVVTKGLNPKVKMKDSGVEWIGEIPKDWSIQPIKYLGRNEPNSIVDGPFGSSINVEVDYGDFEIPVIRTVNITDRGFRNEDLRFMRKDKYESLKRHNVVFGDVLLSKVGTIGNVCIYNRNDIDGILSTTGSCRIRVDENKIFNHFMVYLLLKSKDHLNFLSGLNVQPFLNMMTVKDVRLPIPKIEEQHQIVEYLDTKTSQIDTTIEKETKKIELLKEYRQSLISEIVTGKVDVRTETNHELYREEI